MKLLGDNCQNFKHWVLLSTQFIRYTYKRVDWVTKKLGVMFYKLMYVICFVICMHQLMIEDVNVEHKTTMKVQLGNFLI